MTEHQRGIVLRVLLNRMRHDGGGGHAGRVELLTGIEGTSSRPVRRVVLISNPMLAVLPSALSDRVAD